MTYSNLVDATGLEYFFDLIYLKYLQFIGTSVQQEAGKGLSSNDYTTTEKNKLSGIASGAQVNVIETVKVNGSALTITDKAVDIPVPTNYLTSSDITDMATKTWVGQQNYLTSHQSLSGYATETWVNSKLNDILGVNADAVSSLIAVLSDNNTQTGILNMIAGKADSSSLATVATSGSYNDLTNKPTLFSGSYDDLTNKPTIPSAYTLPIASSSVLGGVKIGTGLSINSETGVLSATVQDISGKANTADLSTVAFSGSYNDLLNKPTLADAQVQADWTESDSTSKAYILHKPSIYTQSEIDTMLANVPFMGEAVVIVSSNSVPTSSTLTYTDAFGSTRNYKIGDEIKVYNSTDTKYDIYKLINLASNTATWEKQGVFDTSVLATVATTGSYNDLTDKPTVPTQVQADWDQTDSTAADYIKNKPVIITAEHVTVTVTAPNGASVVGRTLTLNGTDYVLDSTATVEVDIASGTQYTVSINDLAGYLTPNTSSYTASQASRNISLQYTEVPNGIYAYYSTGALKPSGTSDAIGVAVVTSNCRFVIDKQDASSALAYGGYNTNMGSIGVVCTSTQATAQRDYAGDSNTTKIISKLGSANAPAAAYCRTRFNGSGYLPALGEMYAAYVNKSEVDSMMTAIGGTALTSGYYWTSTLYDASLYAWLLNWSTGNMSIYARNNYYYVRAFLAL